MASRCSLPMPGRRRSPMPGPCSPPSPRILAPRIPGIGEMIFVEGCKDPKSVTLLVRGSTDHVVDEIERAVDDAIGVVAATVEDGKVVAGGGAAEISIARGLKEYADTISGREQLAVAAFAEALEVVPKTLAERSEERRV